MSCTVVGWLKIADASAFEEYRTAVPQTLEPYSGRLIGRGVFVAEFANELNMAEVDGLALLSFADLAMAQAWLNGPEYQSLLAVRSRAIALTLRAFED